MTSSGLSASSRTRKRALGVKERQPRLPFLLAARWENDAGEVVKRRVRCAYPPYAIVGGETAGALRLPALREGRLWIVDCGL